MLRCAACISSGSACVIAFNAAVRSPLFIASSTSRTAPRIWVRRDLFMPVRRAILRVAFLAEVVLAIVSNILRGAVRLAPRAQARRPFNAAIDAGGCERVPENAIAGPRAQLAAPLKELRRCARRHWRPYKGRVLQRQRFPALPGAADKILMRLNFHHGPGNG